MNALILAWVVAGLAGFVCLALYLQGRGSVVRADLAETAAAEAKSEARSLQKQLGKREKQREGRGDETADLRRRLEKAKKRAAQLQAERRSEPERIAALEQELLEKRDELKTLGEEVTLLTGKLARAQESRPEPVAVPAPPPVVEVAPPAPSVDTEELDALRTQVAKLGAKLAEANTLAEQSKSRIKTQDKLYLAMRGELEAKKDRLTRQQEEIERLMAMRVSLLPEPGAEGPTSTEA